MQICYNKFERSDCMANYKKGKIVKATVTGIENYGAFVSLDDYYSGLIHISEMSYGFVKDVNELLKIGETINVEIIEVDDESLHLKLSIKNIPYRKINYTNKHKIIETKSGFSSLNKQLPIWINEKIKKIKKN